VRFCLYYFFLTHFYDCLNSIFYSRESISLSSYSSFAFLNGVCRHKLSKERKKHDQDWFADIVEHLIQPHDLYWDVKHGNAALVFDVADGVHKYKLIVQLNRQTKGRIDGERVSQTGNLIRTIVVEETSNFENGQDYIYLDHFNGEKK